MVEDQRSFFKEKCGGGEGEGKGEEKGGGGVVLQEAAKASRDAAELLIKLMDELSFFLLRGKELQSPEISHEATVTWSPWKHHNSHLDWMSGTDM